MIFPDDSDQQIRMICGQLCLHVCKTKYSQFSVTDAQPSTSGTQNNHNVAQPSISGTQNHNVAQPSTSGAQNHNVTKCELLVIVSINIIT